MNWVDKDKEKPRSFDVLTGKAAEEFMNKIVADYKEDNKRRPEKYARFGYKWNDSTKYKWEPGMREITGFGDPDIDTDGLGKYYEETVRFMVSMGLEWLDENKKNYPTDPDPKYHTVEGPKLKVFGIASDSNKIAEELDKYILWKVEDYFGKEFGPSGAQHHGFTSHIGWIVNHSWPEYVKHMIELQNKEDKEKETEK